MRVLELDTVVRFIDGTKRYILTTIDTETRTSFASVYTNHGSQSASDFLKRCIQVLPDCPTHSQTDNGSEFAKYLHETATHCPWTEITFSGYSGEIKRAGAINVMDEYKILTKKCFEFIIPPW